MTPRSPTTPPRPPTPPSRLQEMFARAMEQPASERDAWLAAECRGDEPLRVGYRLGNAPAFEVNGEPVSELRVVSADPTLVVFEVAGVRRAFEINRAGAEVYVDAHGYRAVLAEQPRFPDPDSHVAAGSLLAPMPDGLKGALTRMLRGSWLDRRRLPVNVGNFMSWGFKSL